jgi:hypothetical protein
VTLGDASGLRRCLVRGDMAVTERGAGAERQRRYKRHKAGDHSLCLPASCDKAGQSSPTVTVGGRGERGARLWAEMADGLGPAHRVLLEEACRIADRLDRLDALLEGRQDAWLRFDSSRDDGGEVRVVIDALLGESRQQATALRGLVAEIRAAMGKSGRPVPVKPKGAGLGDLSARIAARRGAPAG